MFNQPNLESSKLYKFRLQLDNTLGDRRKYFLGRVLTVIDAITENENRKKAIKDLIHEVFEYYKDYNIRLADDVAERIGKDFMPDDEFSKQLHGIEKSGDRFSPLK